ncbi:MAG: right-handed parallel beta-helix repeat-containing protein [Methylococcaceae bacterium]
MSLSNLVVVGSIFFQVSFAMAATLVVDNENLLCSDTAKAGTEQQPFCSIGFAATQALAGDSVEVQAGTYLEHVEIEQSGVSGHPITYTVATGDTAILSGQEYGFELFDVSWIIIEGFDIDSTIKSGIELDTVTDVIIRDNNVTNSGKRGIEIKYSNNVSISNNEVATSFDYGVYVQNSSVITVLDNYVSESGLPVRGFAKKGIFFNKAIDSFIIGNTSESNTNTGISLANGSNNNQVIGNDAFNNARVYVRAAPGIEIRTSTNNTLEANEAYDNEDTGIQLYPGSVANLIKNNISYNNGDHGIDILNSIENSIINNTVYKNTTSGINVEGTSTGTIIANNIAVDNAINSPRTRGNIRVDSTSIPGTSMDFDLLDMSIPSNVMITWGVGVYFSLVDFQVSTGLETMGLQADPAWESQDTGDFRLIDGSPAIDSADSKIGLDRDFNMLARVDDPMTINTGIGPFSYYDRGAHEFRVENIPPTVSIIKPYNNTTVLGQTAMFASADDLDGTVTGVQFRMDGIAIGAEIITEPYSIIWDSTTVVDGAHKLTAVVTDDEGSSIESDVHHLTVANIKPVQLTFIATDDAYIKESSPTNVRGTSSKVWLDALPNRYEILMKFEITGIGARPINDVKLILQTASSSVNGGDVHQIVDNNWSELTVNWNNAPAFDLQSIGNLGVVNKGAAAVLDMTSVITGDGVYSIRIRALSEDTAGYYAKETVGFEPIISILTTEEISKCEVETTAGMEEVGCDLDDLDDLDDTVSFDGFNQSEDDLKGLPLEPVLAGS